jgi:hypothetical protein
MMRMRSLWLLLVGSLLAAVLATPASASQLIDRNASHVRLVIDREGRALLTYQAAGVRRHVLVLGNAINALPTMAGGRQVRFTLDYSGGWGTYHRVIWPSFKGACNRYDGPPLPWLVTACKAPDGSYWAVQGFPQPLPDLGFTPWLTGQRAVWLELSHWSGPLAQLQVWQDWVYDNRYNEIFGRVTYHGQPVFGLGTTRYGAPTDNFGRLIYLDTYNSIYGPGWRRENSFVPHNPTGIFCYGFFPFDPTRSGYQHPVAQTQLRGPGTGSRYRLTVQGPGVTPDISWQGPALSVFQPGNPNDISLQEQMTGQLLQILGPDKQCGHGHST